MQVTALPIVLDLLGNQPTNPELLLLPPCTHHHPKPTKHTRPHPLHSPSCSPTIACHSPIPSALLVLASCVLIILQQLRTHTSLSRGAWGDNHTQPAASKQQQKQQVMLAGNSAIQKQSSATETT